MWSRTSSCIKIVLRFSIEILSQITHWQHITVDFGINKIYMITLEGICFKVTRAWRETTPVSSGLTRLVRAGYSRHDSGASRERARITRRAQDGSVHMQRSLPSSSYPARSTLNKLHIQGKFYENLRWVQGRCKVFVLNKLHIQGK